MKMIEASYSTRIKNIDLESDGGCIDMITKMRGYLGQMVTTADQLKLEALFLKEKYGQFSLEDCYIAMDLFVMGKLDVDVPQRVIFSPMIIANIMNAYLRFRKKIIRDVIERGEREVIMLDQDKGNRLEGLKEIVAECYEHSKDNFKHWFYNKRVLELLVNTKRFTATDEIKRQAHQYANKQFLIDRKNNLESKYKKHKHDLMPVSEITNANPAYMFKADRKSAEYSYRVNYYLKTYFESIDINELLNSITEKDLQ